MTRNASGKNFEVHSSLQDLLSRVVVDYNDPKDDEEEEEDPEGQGAGGEGGEGGSGSGGTGDPSVKDPDKKRLSDEAAKYRKERNAAKKELEEAQKRLREVDDASKTELEKAQRDLSEATAKLDRIEASNTVQARKIAFYESGSAGRFKNPKHALQLLDLTGLELNDEGEYDEAKVKERVDALLKESPYLGADADGDAGDGGTNKEGTGGEPRNPRRKKEQEARTAALQKKFPALATRVS